MISTRTFLTLIGPGLPSRFFAQRWVPAGLVFYGLAVKISGEVDATLIVRGFEADHYLFVHDAITGQANPPPAANIEVHVVRFGDCLVASRIYRNTNAGGRSVALIRREFASLVLFECFRRAVQNLCRPPSYIIVCRQIELEFAEVGTRIPNKATDAFAAVK